MSYDTNKTLFSVPTVKHKISCFLSGKIYMVGWHERDIKFVIYVLSADKMFLK